MLIQIKDQDQSIIDRKAIKNPFYKIHAVAMENGGDLPEEKRKEMMKEAILEIREALQDVKSGNGQ